MAYVSFGIIFHFNFIDTTFKGKNNGFYSITHRMTVCQIKVILVAFFMVVVFRKSNDEELSIDEDDDIKKNKYLKDDEEWLHQPVSELM